ncbi:MAG TPA: acyl-CoA dehydrogenase family protein [Opitutaceae bacterium]|nr:acyl-CoA dehydrogenase family protein [Opitutaceae bacterium]
MLHPHSLYLDHLSPADLAFLEQVREFVAREIAPHAAGWEEREELPRDLFTKAGRAGLMGVVAPREAGGRGLSMLCYCLAIEEVARACGAFAMNLAAHNALCVGHPLGYASDELKRKIFPRALNGDWMVAWALTEPGAGSDTGGVETFATPRPDGAWELNGHKTYITMGLHSDRMVVMAVTGKDEKGKKEFSAFWVETRDISPVRKVKTSGVRASNTSEFHLKGVRGELIGARGEGQRAALACLDAGRLGIAGMAIGLGRGAVEIAKQRMLTRRQFGKRIAEFQALQFMLADCELELRASEALLLQPCVMHARGQKFTLEASFAKLHASEAATRACNRALQICGGWGYTRDTGVERMWRDARLTEIGEGSSEVQRLIISRALLREAEERYGAAEKK